MDEIREHGLPLPSFQGEPYLYYTMISFSPWTLFVLLNLNLPEPLRFERVGGVLQRSWILGITISSGGFVPSPLLLWGEWCVSQFKRLFHCNHVPTVMANQPLPPNPLPS